MKTTKDEPAAPVRVTMLRPVRVNDGPRSMPRDLGGAQEIDGPRAIAWTLLGYCRPDPGWTPDPRDTAAAAAIAFSWLEGERRQRGQSDEDFSRVPANARRIAAVLQLIEGRGPTAA